MPPFSFRYLQLLCHSTNCTITVVAAYPPDHSARVATSYPKSVLYRRKFSLHATFQILSDNLYSRNYFNFRSYLRTTADDGNRILLTDTCQLRPLPPRAGVQILTPASFRPLLLELDIGHWIRLVLSGAASILVIAGLSQFYLQK